MQQLDVSTAWIAVSILVTMVAVHKVMKREQPIGFSAFILVNLAHLTAIFFGREKLAFALQVPAVTILFTLLLLEWQYHRKKRAIIPEEK